MGNHVGFRMKPKMTSLRKIDEAASSDGAPIQLDLRRAGCAEGKKRPIDVPVQRRIAKLKQAR